jgi:serine/threonine protein kinase
MGSGVSNVGGATAGSAPGHMCRQWHPDRISLGTWCWRRCHGCILVAVKVPVGHRWILVKKLSMLAYLHCCRSHAIIHAGVKLSNVLLDVDNASRLIDFGTPRVVHMKPLVDEEENVGCRTGPMGTMGYMNLSSS